jgi:hypothetical protein
MPESPLTRSELQIMLHALDRQIEDLKVEHPEDACFWPAFAGQADEITDAAGPSDYDWALAQIDVLLEKHGRVAPLDIGPSDDLPPA